MDFLIILQTIFLGIIEGLTEFIPVSSTGHLILFIDILGFKTGDGKVFEIVIQLGAILAVCFLYREKLFKVATNMHKDKESFLFARNVTIAFIPSLIIGFLAHDFIKSVLFSPLIVSISLVTGGILIILIEKMNLQPKHTEIEKFSVKKSLGIGFCQVLAMIPGTSRSGATIMGALLLGVERKTATEFSFFLAIPTMIGATIYDLYKNYDLLTTDHILIIIIGFISAFLSALLVVKTVISFISKHGFTIFGYYRIIFGSIMLAFILS